MCGKYGILLKGLKGAGSTGKVPRIPGAGSSTRPMRTKSIGGSKRLK